MTDEISIRPGLITDHGWEFSVSIGSHRHLVSLSQAYWRKLTNGDISPQDLVRLGLEYAIERHFGDSLPSSFALDVLASRIDDFDKHVRMLAHAEAAANPR